VIKVQSNGKNEPLVEEILDEKIRTVAITLSKKLRAVVVVLRGISWDKHGKVQATQAILECGEGAMKRNDN
jgi:hypothetical protein